MTKDTIAATGRIDTKTYDVSPPEELSEEAKLEWLRDHDPVDENIDYNTTLFGMHEYFAINLDPTQELEEDITHLAVGDDDTAPDSENEELNNEVFRKGVTDYSQNGNTILASTFIASDEANGNTFREVGLFAGGAEPGDAEYPERMWNHSTIADIAKDDTRTITIDVTLEFSAV